MPIDVTDVETDYRANNYQDSKAIKKKQIVCSSCGTELGTKLGKLGAVFVHPFTNTLQCKKCKDFYGDGDFSMDEDGDDKYCRICGNGGELYICGNKPCPYGFCLKCIKRYIGENSTDIEADDWKCLHCNCKPLWKARAICAIVSVEHARNRRKYNKKPTKAEVYESDDNCSLSEDIDNSHENSKLISRRSLRSKFSDNRINSELKKLQKLKQICDGSEDSSDRSKRPYKPVVHKQNTKAQSSFSQSSADRIPVQAKKSSESARANKRKFKGSVSSENEDDIPPKEPKFSRADIKVKTVHESKNKQYSKNASNSLPKHKEVVHLTPKNSRILRFTKNVEKPIGDSDSSDHESTSDFAESKKNRNVCVNKKSLSKKDENNQMEETVNSETSDSMGDVGRLFKKVDESMKNKESHRSLKSFHPSRRVKEVHPSNELDTSESDETTVLDVSPKQNMKLISGETEANERFVDSKTKGADDSGNCHARKRLSSRSDSNTESRQASVSSKRRERTWQPLFSLNNENGILDKKKLMIKKFYAKVASTKDHVNKNQAKVMRDHTIKLTREMDKLGKAFSIGAVRIEKKHLYNNFTKIRTVSKTALKCALLINRCKKELNRIDHQFMEYYNEWCKACKTSSIFPDMKNTDLTSSSAEELLLMRKNSVDTKRINETGSNDESEKTTDNMTNSKTYDELDKNVSESSINQTSNDNSGMKNQNRVWKLSIGEKSVVSPENSEHSKSKQKKNETRQTLTDEEVEKTHSDADLRNSEHNEVSEFDSDEIFSEDESRKQTKEADQSQSKNYSGVSCSPETSKKAITESSESHPENDSSGESCSPETSKKAITESSKPDSENDSSRDGCSPKSSKKAITESSKSHPENDSSGGSCSPKTSEKAITESSKSHSENDSSKESCSPETSKKALPKSTESDSDDAFEKSRSPKSPKTATKDSTKSNTTNDSSMEACSSEKPKKTSTKSTKSYSHDLIEKNRSSKSPEKATTDSTELNTMNDSSEETRSQESSKKATIDSSKLNCMNDSAKETGSPKKSEKESTAITKSISDEQIIGKKDSASSSQSIREKSSDLVDTVTKVSDLAENQEQRSKDELIDHSSMELAKQNTEKSPAESSTKNAQSLDSSFQDIFNATASPIGSEDKESIDRETVLSDSESRRTERNDSLVTLLYDDESTLELWPELPDSELNLRVLKQVENERKNSDDDLSKNGNEDDKDISDCDEEIIFTQLASKDLCGKSKANQASDSTALAENLTESRDNENTTKSDVDSTEETRLQENVQCLDNKINPKTATPQSLETLSPLKPIAEANDDAADVNRNERIKKSNRVVFSEPEKTISQRIEDEADTLNTSEDQPKNARNISSLNNEENETKNNIDEFEGKETGQSQKKQTSIFESDSAEVPLDSEEAIKRKMLESDSELSDDTTEQCLRLNDFELRLNSDSNDDTNQMDSSNSSTTLITSDQSNSNDKPENIEVVKKKCKESSSSPLAVDEEDDLNEVAKKRLLSSSNSSSSDTDAIRSILPRYSDRSDSDSGASQKNVSEISSNSIHSRESTSLIRSKIKRKNKFSLEKNSFYTADKKLQMNCEVVIRRLNEKVLDQFRQLLNKSKERQESTKFQSLIDLNTVNKRKRDTGDQDSSSGDSSSLKVSSKGRVKKRKPKEPEETLLDYLERMKNGENDMNLSADETEENDEIPEGIPLNQNNVDDFTAQVNEVAKDWLIQSSDSESESEKLSSMAETEQEKVEDARPKTKKDKSIKNKETEDLGSNHENGSSAEKGNDEAGDEEENVDAKESGDSDSERTQERKKMKAMLAKRNWRLTDSDSSSEQKKWDKSQTKEEDEEKKDMEIKDKDKGKRKKNTKRRVLGSDSDSVKLTDESDDSGEDVEREKKSGSDSEDSTELFDTLRKKRRKKRNAAQKTDSDSESGEDSKPVKQKRKRIKHVETDSDSNNDGLNSSRDTQGKLHRKNIRPVLKNKQVADVTKIAGKEEEERLKRISERQKLYNEMYELKLASEAKVDKLVLDFDEETKKELISVHEDLVKRLKPHQAQGIKFMWDACFESLERTKTEKGSGCIVAHCMGLGKTFQVVTLAHTLLTHPETGIKTVMVVCPLSTVLNWVNEFKKWLGDINNGEDVEVYEMTKMKKNFERKYQLEKWKRTGGVMILGYEMFRLLSNQKGKKMRKNLHEAILKCLLNPGPDLIVCDEGHLLKNEDTALSKAMRRINTLRRIVLTGTPLQNNLVEYHCMVQFVKPNLLGTKKEFSNRFVNPITNGQFDDSTEYDVKLMKKRAHVLHKMLEGSVQRFDYSVLTPFLPPKQEYVITVRLADIQIKLYQYYIDNFSRKTVGSGTSLFADFQALQRIWTHPIVLRMNAEKMERINEKKRLDASDSEGSLRDFLDDGSEDRTTTTSDSDIQSIQGSSDEKTEKSRRRTRANPIDDDAIKSEEEDAPQAGEWWSQFVEPEHFEDMRISSKLVLLFAILKESEQIGDKVLVFSQSLYALSLIEEFLSKIDDETQRGTCSELIDGHSGSWSLGLDYFRLDGQTAPENRSQYCKIFNNPKNSRARLFLISTRAGGLGINLTAANRVIIFDASWNPSHDVQSIFRIYRFGQRKPCYVYRFLAQGTMEEKIYNRQVTKLSLSCRVVDEQQIERHYSNHDLAELYEFEPNTNKEKPTLNLPKDRLLAEIFRKYEDRIETFHEHDSLLENKAEEELDEEERKEAWKEYEDERMGRKMYMNNFNNQNYLTQQYNEMLHANQAEIANRATLSGINIENLEALIRKDYPNATPEHQKAMTARTIMEMYAYMENETIRQQHLAAAASSFTYPTASNFGTTSTVDKNVMTPAQRQYVFQQQQMQQQQLQQLLQREQQANYAKRFGNVRIQPAVSATATRPPPVVDLQTEDSEVMEVPTTAPAAAGPATSSSVQTPAVASFPDKRKSQEE